MPPTLRSHRCCSPPALYRMSALMRVELTRSGQRHARKLCLDPAPLRLYLYFTTDSHGALRYHLTDAADATRVFDRHDAVPEYRVV